MERKVKFGDLTFPSKIGIVGGWIALIIYIVSFLFGVFVGIMEI